jgi:8-oxo-dGTP diphosphatase
MKPNTLIHIVTRGIIIKDNHILLARHPRNTSGYYYLPGGHVEHGEGAQHALLRELDEEIGGTFFVKRFLGCLEHTFTPAPGKRVCHTHEYNFLFEIDAADLNASMRPAQKEEHVMFEWHSMANLPSTWVLPKPIVKLIPQWLENSYPHSFSSEVVTLK